MNSKESVVRMRDLERLYLYHMDAGAEGLGWEAEKEAREIYEKHVGCLRYERDLSPYCQEIKEIWVRFDSQNTGIQHSEEQK